MTMPRPWLRIACALIGLPGTVACYAAAARPVPQLTRRPPALLDTVTPGTAVRVIVGGRQLAGTIAIVSADWLSIDRSGRDTTIARLAVDTIWVRGGRTYHGTKTGAIAGLVAAGGLLLTQRGSEEAANVDVALRVSLALFGFGVFGDILSPYSWTAIPLGQESD
jgi:hypothetical protein